MYVLIVDQRLMIKREKSVLRTYINSLLYVIPMSYSCLLIDDRKTEQCKEKKKEKKRKERKLLKFYNMYERKENSRGNVYFLLLSYFFLFFIFFRSLKLSLRRMRILLRFKIRTCQTSYRGHSRR